jgi:hypothetical protein
VLVIETTGTTVPWDSLDQLEMDMKPEPDTGGPEEPPEEVDSGNGMAEMEPPQDPPQQEPDFGRTHFKLTPHRFEEMPSPGGHDPEKIPTKPEEVDESMMVMWVPRHPDIDVTWAAGEAVAPVFSHVEWNIQEKAEQPRPERDKPNSHDAFESLCLMNDCEVIGEYTPSNDIPKETSGQVERKGKQAYEEGKYGGGNWSV